MLSAEKEVDGKERNVVQKGSLGRGGGRGRENGGRGEERGGGQGVGVGGRGGRGGEAG